jgi:hypothetical protein
MLTCDTLNIGKVDDVIVMHARAEVAVRTAVAWQGLCNCPVD